MVPSLLRTALVDRAARAEGLALHAMLSTGPPGAGSGGDRPLTDDSACRDRFQRGDGTDRWMDLGRNRRGEMTAGEDGLYVVYEGRIGKCGVPL
jgi:hypothetical protein